MPKPTKQTEVQAAEACAECNQWFKIVGQNVFYKHGRTIGQVPLTLPQVLAIIRNHGKPLLVLLLGLLALALTGCASSQIRAQAAVLHELAQDQNIATVEIVSGFGTIRFTRGGMSGTNGYTAGGPSGISTK